MCARVDGEAPPLGTEAALRSILDAEHVPAGHHEHPEAQEASRESHRALARFRRLHAHPEPLDKIDLAAAVDVPITSGGFKNNLGKLRTLGAIDYPSPGMVAATPMLFPEEA